MKLYQLHAHAFNSLGIYKYNSTIRRLEKSKIGEMKVKICKKIFTKITFFFRSTNRSSYNKSKQNDDYRFNISTFTTFISTRLQCNKKKSKDTGRKKNRYSCVTGVSHSSRFIGTRGQQVKREESTITQNIDQRPRKNYANKKGIEFSHIILRTFSNSDEKRKN